MTNAHTVAQAALEFSCLSPTPVPRRELGFQLEAPLSINKQLAFADTFPSSRVNITTPEAVLEGSVSSTESLRLAAARLGAWPGDPAPRCVLTSCRPRARSLGWDGADSVADEETD